MTRTTLALVLALFLSAACGRDLGVGRSAEPLSQFIAAIAGENHVRVRIDKPGDQ